MIKDKVLSEKVAVVTGGDGYLGKMFSRTLSAAGAEVYILDIDNESGQETAHSISKETGEKVSFLLADVADKRKTEALFDKIKANSGRIDILVNAAIGVGKNHFTTVENYSEEDWQHVMEVNVWGTLNCCNAAAEHMKSAGSGSIINIGSIYGMVGADQRIYGSSGINSPAVYAASKGAILNLTRYLAVYWGNHNIRVNSISPGGVFNHQSPEFIEKYNQKTPMGRMLQKEELAGALLFLATEQASSSVNGHNLVVDGGLTAW